MGIEAGIVELAFVAAEAIAVAYVRSFDRGWFGRRLLC